ncbi:hypothetical protein GOP47_0024041 [Adiantum capillus-veneris]|uniref:Uncharacterized protein n=1 Tax=Adiantum capillus-veneris TaxID=13818 RepID=A0A9D4U4P9_ADICA|nr:hypothetical protein GOP47_0024041 [Adiantum capillus-veneris]
MGTWHEDLTLRLREAGLESLSPLRRPYVKVLLGTSVDGVVKYGDYKVRIIEKINHAGEVNRARYMPQKPVIIATKTVSGEVHLFDYTMHPSTPSRQQSSPYLRLAGHSAEGHGLAWSKEGYLLSGSYDAMICLWDTNSGGSRSGILPPLHSFQCSSTDAVGDVAWHSDSDELFGSVGDDGKLLIWDHRASTRPTQTVKVNGKGLNCLAFEPRNKELVAMGSADGTLAMHDLRQLSRPLHNLLTHEGEVTLVVWDLTRIDTQEDATSSASGAAPRPKPLFTHVDHSSMVPDFSWSEISEGMIASIDADNSLQIWQMATSVYHP